MIPIPSRTDAIAAVVADARVVAATDTEGIVVAAVIEAADRDVFAAADGLCRPVYRDLYEPDRHCFYGLRILDPLIIHKRLSWLRSKLIGLDTAVSVTLYVPGRL